MAEFDVRKGNAKITTIVFGEQDRGKANTACNLSLPALRKQGCIGICDGEGFFMNIRKENIDDLIKALTLAKSLWSTE